MTFKQVVQAVQAVAVAAALVFAIMLFANDGADGDEATVSSGAKLYSANCSSCHGSDGGGGLGPKLVGVVTKSFPDIEDQIAFVSKGKGVMPAFGDELTGEQLRDVVEYTRTELGS